MGNGLHLNRRQILKSHLVTRAVENGMPIASVNTLSACQTAPVAIFDQYGRTLLETQPNEERLLAYDFQPPEDTFGSRGIAANNQYFLENLGEEQAVPASPALPSTRKPAPPFYRRRGLFPLGQAVPMIVIFSAERPVCSITTSCTMSPSLS